MNRNNSFCYLFTKFLYPFIHIVLYTNFVNSEHNFSVVAENIYVQTYELVFYHKTAEIQYRYKLLMPYISFKRYKYSP